MNSKIDKGLFKNLRYDMPAGFIVFLVAMPLCLGIAMASGAPLLSGVISGIVGGIVVASISKSPLGVSGPAAGLTAIILTGIDELGSFEIFLSAVVVAGLIQIVLGVIKAGVIGYYFPSSVIKGMLTGIGLIIVLKQLSILVGYSGDSNSLMSGEYTLQELITPTSIVIGLISMTILIVWEQPFMKRIALFKLLQGPLVVVVVGIVINVILSSYFGVNLSTEQLVNLPLFESVDNFMESLVAPDFSQVLNRDLLMLAFTIAIVASLETLLSVEATDKLDPQRRVTDTNRELLAQGVGNMVSGLIGGLPITQVVVRSSANIQSGGRTKISVIFHGVLLLLALFTFPKVLNMIPLSALAAILVAVGYKLAKPSIFKDMFGRGTSQFVPFIVTVIGIMLFDLLVGVLMGLTVAIFHILWRNLKQPYSFNIEKRERGSRVLFELAEQVSFLNKAAIRHALKRIESGSHVTIDATRCKTVHPDVWDIIDDFKEHCKTTDIVIDILEPLDSGSNDALKEFNREMRHKSK